MARYQQQLYALGSTCFLTIVSDESEARVYHIFASLVGQIADFENRYSRFLADSELTIFNQQAGHKTVVSPGFLKLLKTVQQLSKQTDGLYNPFILPALQNSGYIGSWPNPEQSQPNTDYRSRNVMSANSLEIGDKWARIPENSAIDLGGIGKGYLLDALAQSLQGHNLQGYWLSLGGDILCAGHDQDSQPWKVAIQNATNRHDTVENITNSTGEVMAIATSGVIKRRGDHNGLAWHHIIDPRTGRPAKTNILTVTAVAKQATIADVFAKCILIAGTSQANKYRSDHKITSFIVQTGKPLTTKSAKVRS